MEEPEMYFEEGRNSTRARYSQLVKDRPELFENPPDADFSILLDESDIEAAQKCKSAQLKEIWPDSWAEVGVPFEDEYWLMLRDAVRFPSGKLGTYDRIIHPSHTSAGVAILPRIQDKLVVVRHFRHATRSWHWEIPRGFPNESLGSEENASLEIKEELNAVCLSLQSLGKVHADTGLLGLAVDLYLADIHKIEKLEAEEGIVRYLLLTMEEFGSMVATGEITDSFTLAAYARIKAMKH